MKAELLPALGNSIGFTNSAIQGALEELTSRWLEHGELDPSSVITVLCYLVEAQAYSRDAGDWLKMVQDPPESADLATAPPPPTTPLGGDRPAAHPPAPERGERRGKARPGVIYRRERNAAGGAS